MKNHALILKTILFISVISISCTHEIPDPVHAQKFVEDFMQKINSNDFTNLSDYYSEEMHNGEGDEDRIAKFEQLPLCFHDPQQLLFRLCIFLQISLIYALEFPHLFPIPQAQALYGHQKLSQRSRKIHRLW